MKKILIVLAVGAAITAGADTKTEYQKYANARRYCVSRVVEGDKVITTWFRNGRPDWVLPAVETNSLRTIAGKEQNNPIQDALVEAARKASENWNAYTNQVAQTVAYSNAYVIAQGVANAATAKIQDEIADLEAKIAKYKEYQTKYPIVKSLFAAMIADAENRIKILQALTGGE